MATLITVKYANGTQRRCDAKCYNAKHPRCKCVCGGMNHGVGLNSAIRATEGLAEDYLEQISNPENPPVRIKKTTPHPVLFEEGVT